MFRVGIIAILLNLPAVAPADETPDPKAEAELVSQIAEEEANHWTFTVSGDQPLARDKSVALKWSNPSVGRIYGEVYLWTDRGCPAAVGSFYKWFTPWTDFTLEFKTLGHGKPVGLRDGERFWTPATEDVEFQKIKDAPPPDESPTVRLRQMRTFAEEFSVTLHDTRIETEKGSEKQLRCLTRPIYRYDSSNPAILDGSVFAFVEGTDPETLLLLEARTEGAAAHWEFAFARMNIDSIIGRYRDKEVWRVDPLDSRNEPKSPYTLFQDPRTP